MPRRRRLDPALSVVPETADLAVYNIGFLTALEASPVEVRVAVIPETAACRGCAARTGVFDRDSLPALPHADCTMREGCGCWYAATFEGR